MIAFLGDSRGKIWDDGLICYEQLIAQHPLGPETINLHQGGSSSGTEYFYRVKPYGGEWFDLETDGLITQVDTLIRRGANPKTVVINSTGNDQLIAAQMYPVDSEAEQATIDAQQWVKDYRAKFFADDATQTQFTIDCWRNYSWHKMSEAIKTLKHYFDCEVIVIGPLGWQESPLVRNANKYRDAVTVSTLYQDFIRELCTIEGVKFLDVLDIDGPWKSNEGDTAIHIAQEGHNEIARRLMNQEW